MKVGFLQFAPQENSIKENIAFIIKQTESINNALIVLPELFLSSYNDFEPIEYTELPNILKNLLRHSFVNKLSFIGSIAVSSGKVTRNQGIYINNGKIINTYAKRKLYGFEESHFLAGDTEYGSVKYLQNEVVTQICIDNINAKIGRNIAEEGAVVLAAPSTVSVDFLNSVLKSRSLENQLITIFANRVGKEKDGIEYSGLSTIFLPSGEEIKASKKRSCLRITNITKSQLSNYQKTRKMLFKEMYGEK